MLAHDSPEHVIQDLTARMTRQGRSAELLYRRACEYRALGKLPLAERDLLDSLKLDQNHQPARVELARVEIAQGKTVLAKEAIERALSAAKSDEERAGLWIVRSDILAARRDFSGALADCQLACAERPAEIDWQLKRSQLRDLLGQQEVRSGELQAAYEQTKSIVLKIEWIEALIDAGKMETALREIEAELADCRWRSSWLLRRARARDKLGDGNAAQADLREAIVEISGRINPARPDGSLLADRGLAHALLTDWQAAQADLAAARAAGADAWMVKRLETTLAGRIGK